MIRSSLLVAVFIASGLSACEKSKPAPPPPPPAEALVSAMRDYCRIGAMPAERQDEARKIWGWQTAGNKDVGPIWNRAVVNKDRAAIATIWAAAEQAVGKGNCPVLDPLGR